MARGINTSGEYDVSELQLGRGILKAAEINATGLALAYRDLGSVVDVVVSVATEKLEHKGSRAGLKTIDKTVGIEATSEIKFVMESINFQNLALFFSGAESAYTNPAIAGVADQEFIAAADLESNAWYTLRSSTGPVFGLTATNALVIESTNATPVVLTETTDYTVNAVTGQVFIKSSTAVDAIVAAGVDGLSFTLTADATATEVDQVVMLSNITKTLALRFDLEDADSGEFVVYEYYQVSLGSDGDYALISDEWATLPMSGSVETNSAYGVAGKAFYPKTQ